MAWNTTDSLEEFLAAAGGFLRADPVPHTVLLSVGASLRAGTRSYGDDAPYYGWWSSSDGTARGALLCTPPYPVVLSQMPEEAAVALATTLAHQGRPVSGATGGRTAAEGFGAAWQRRTGTVPRPDGTNRLYRLHEPVPPRPAPPGAARTATSADRELLIAWFAAFAAEVSAGGGDQASAVDDKLEHGGVTLWEADGVPVSFAAVSRAVAGMVRVAPVYTPAGHRGRGYAGAVTTAAGRAALDAGADEVLLFADLTNPTTNALYQRIGYRPVEDHIGLSFD
ncbi:GNAT family N-acetyltransferase [Streptomyces sp. bgisy100]|uniref:GNAT family N-acetyltransferase n=1 Tax=Streptomyces sp. bgisy100 TaxID=3413783 RepID=UPI003D753548